MPWTVKVRAAQGARAAEDDPDALYRERADLAKAQQAAEIWSGRLATNHRDFESAWKLARAEYWLGTQAPESYGLRQGIKYRGAIKDALETIMKIDPSFQKGSADRALGRWYLMVPGLFGGSKTKSEEHLRKSLTFDPDSTASHYFLADTLFEMNRDAEARAELQKVIAAPIDPEWAAEDRDFKEKAAKRLSVK